jgi:hypothetical protein
MIRDRRRLYNEDFHNLCSSQQVQVKEDDVGRDCSTHGRKEVCIQGFDEKARK